MIPYTIRRIHLFPAFRVGCLVGSLVLLLPGLLLGLLARGVVALLRQWLEGWQNWSANLPLGSLPEVNFLDLLNLAEFLRNLRVLDDNGWLLALTVILATAILGGLLAGLLALFGAAGYNLLAELGGGLVVSADTPAPMPGATPTAGPAGPVPPKKKTLALPRIWASPQPQASAGARLVSRQSPQLSYPLKAGLTTIGSAPGNDIVLPGLQPHHTEIRFENNRYILYDQSGGQVTVQQRPVQGANMLKRGFEVRLGTYEFVFQPG
jgi:hypothetical protein